MQAGKSRFTSKFAGFSKSTLASARATPWGIAVHRSAVQRWREPKRHGEMTSSTPRPVSSSSNRRNPEVARKIIFHCNLERLWPYNAGGDLDLYALNYSISVDLNGDSSAPVEEITPWHCVDASMIAASADDPAKPVPVTPGYEPAVLILDDLKRD